MWRANVKLIVQTVVVLVLATALGLSLGRLAQAANMRPHDRIVIHSSLEPNVMLMHTSGQTLAIRTR